jgi:crotonobetainyl-CoA:carnitine CoA-transferase CaiB-like acyl-CoA transferase
MLTKFVNEKDKRPSFPGNILADFAGGGSFGVIGVLMALI